MISTVFLRNLAATLTLLSGLLQVALLWFVALTPEAVLVALLGVVYLITAVGLYGQSRFTLALASIGPIAGALLSLQLTQLPLGTDLWLKVVADGLITICSALVLWRVRHQPSR
jgi:hypothetical protein